MSNKWFYLILFGIWLLILPLKPQISTNPNIYSEENRSNLINSDLELSQEEEWRDVWAKYERDFGYGIAINNITGDIYITGYNLTGPPGWGDSIILSKYSNEGISLWNKTWNPTGYHYGRDIAIDSQGYVYVVGSTNKEGTMDVLLIKFDENGNEIWNTTYDAAGASDDGWALTIDKDDYIYITGYCYNGTNLEDALLLKYNDGGTLEWDDIWGDSGFQRGYDIAIDSSGNIYITGLYKLTINDILILKYNSLGNPVDYNVYGMSNDDMGRGIAIDSYDNVYITGYTNVTGNHNIILVKYSSSLIFQWVEHWGDIKTDEGFAIALDSDESIYIGGFTIPSSVNTADVAVLKYNAIGDLKWDLTWNQSSNSDIRDWCRDIAIDSSDNLYCIGDLTDMSVFPVLSDIFVLKYTLKEEEPSNGEEFKIPGYELIIFSFSIIIITAVILKKFRKD